MSKTAINITKDQNTVDLYIRLVSQNIINPLGEIGILAKLGLLTNKEDWINGITQYLYKELPESKEFNPSTNLVIGDFNPTLTKIREQVEKVEKLYITSDGIVHPEILRAFANPKAKSTYVNRKKEDLFTRLKLDVVNKLFSTLLQGTDKIATYDVDAVIDTKAIKVNNKDETEGQRVKRVLKLINKKVKELEVPKVRSKWAVDNSYKIQHSASPAQLVLFVNAGFEIETNEMLSSIYHYEKILPKSNIISLDFTQFAGVDEKLDCLLIDKRAFVNATWISQISQEIKLPLFKSKFELAYSLGFAKKLVYPVYQFAKSA